MMINSTQSNIGLKIRLLHTQEKQLWDALVASDAHSCFMQSWAWADFKELEGYQTFRYGLFAEEQLVGGCIFHFYPHPSKANLLMAPGGPILTFPYLEVGIELLLKQAELLVDKLGAIALRIEPLWLQ
ncbi:MAG TPA: peptidoglycan bridge formation glycyltransferase FemA/FemB family protein, partial [Phormidium sp.]